MHPWITHSQGLRPGSAPLSMVTAFLRVGPWAVSLHAGSGAGVAGAKVHLV